jgi:uncharacterized RDD family membrane protein YckC
MKRPPSKFRPSITEELELAEEEHLKNCPNAEFSVRLAAAIVDGILSYLAITGLESLGNAFSILLDHFPITSFFHRRADMLTSTSVITLKVMFFYFYFIASTSFSGGSPGKLLLGLRVLNANNGKNLTPAQALVRWVLSLGINFLSCGVVYLMATLNADHRAYHDELTRTVVKKVHGVR